MEELPARKEEVHHAIEEGIEFKLLTNPVEIIGEDGFIDRRKIGAMVFGNLGDTSATGVGFTRDPATGEKVFWGEFLVNAQGEDVVAGIRTPKKIAQLKDEMPKVYEQFVQIAHQLEKHYRDVQDMEFTVERGKLWMLQTRTGKRTAQAAVKIAVDMANEGLITKEQAVARVTPDNVDSLLHPQFDPKAVDAAKKENRIYAKGVNASPGAAVGQAYFDADTAEKLDVVVFIGLAGWYPPQYDCGACGYATCETTS